MPERDEPSCDRSTPWLPPAAIGNAYARGLAWSVLEDIVAIGDRMAGTGGEAAAADRIERGFSEAGLREVRTLG